MALCQDVKCGQQDEDETVITPQHSVVMYKTCVCLFICFVCLFLVGYTGKEQRVIHLSKKH